MAVQLFEDSDWETGLCLVEEAVTEAVTNFQFGLIVKKRGIYSVHFIRKPKLEQRKAVEVWNVFRKPSDPKVLKMDKKIPFKRYAEKNWSEEYGSSPKLLKMDDQNEPEEEVRWIIGPRPVRS